MNLVASLLLAAVTTIPVFDAGRAGAFRKAEWRKVRHEKIMAEIAADTSKNYDLVMVGDSLTELWEWESPRWGSEVLADLRKNHKVLNLGYGGDKTQDVLGRIEKGELDGYSARVISLCIGTNNWKDSPEDIAAGVRLCLDKIIERHPESKIVLFACIPCRNQERWTNNQKVNELIRPFADGKKIVWDDFGYAFLTKDGSVKEEMMPDGLHPVREGYLVWRKHLLNHLEAQK